MSNRREATRSRILQRTRELLEGGSAAPSMAEIARASGVTRQLLYHHFDGRADLLMSLARRVDAEVRTPELQARVDRAASGREALAEAVALQGHIKPRIAAIAATVDQLRASDPDAAAAWEERESHRHRRIVQLVERLDAEGLLAEGWEVPVAARLVWSVTSQRAWTELVAESGWTTRQWVEHTTRLLEAALLTPRPASRG